MSGGILAEYGAIPLIMEAQNCDWDAARRLWRISMDIEAERQIAEAELTTACGSNVIPFRRKH